MSEEDYEVDANGKRQIHRHRLLVEDLMEKKQPPTKKKIQKPSSNKKLPSKSVGVFLFITCLFATNPIILLSIRIHSEI